MPADAWSTEENDLIVADYFAMLGEDVHARPYSKADGLAPIKPDTWLV